MTRDDQTPSLFGEPARPQPRDEPADERRRRQNGIRQMAWRRRHQFLAPLIEAPDGPSPCGATYTTRQ